MVIGTGPVDGANEHVAATNLSAFLAAVRDQAALERETRGAGGEVGEPVQAAEVHQDTAEVEQNDLRQSAVAVRGVRRPNPCHRWTVAPSVHV